jgi:membrane carboxypeptidase/penicillin-binding protein
MTSDAFQLLPATIERLQKHAKPFIDTVDTVVNRLLDAYEGGQQAADNDEDDVVTDGNIQDFSNQTPVPNLTHTKVLSVEFNRIKFARNETTWNALLNETIRFAKKTAKSDDEFKRLVTVNWVKGKKEDGGYRYLPDVNVSVQGQDANAAWRGALHIAKQSGRPIEVVFIWRMKEGAAHPGKTGKLAWYRTRFI